ncbi:MAG: phosphotransferase [Gemmatimonadota bacterium]
MELDLLQPAVVAWFKRQAAALGMDQSRLTAEYRLNWGGFVNQSFRITDGATSYHLKLAGSADGRRRLGHWYQIHPPLTERYRAPRVVAWVVIPGTDHAGLLFEDVPGEPPQAWSEALQDEVAATVSRLHRDTDVRRYLRKGELAGSCESVFRETFITRFAEDLATIEVTPPPFVTAEHLAWMTQEVNTLEEAAVEAPAFAAPADHPIHADLWINNVIVGPTGAWALVDWDDLRLGDPALDYAVLFGPTAASMKLADPARVLPYAEIERDPGVLARIPLYGRATLLDWVIDSLADYVDAGAVAEHTARVREEKERVHRLAKQEYQRTYCSG